MSRSKRPNIRSKLPKPATRKRIINHITFHAPLAERSSHSRWVYRTSPFSYYRLLSPIHLGPADTVEMEFMAPTISELNNSTNPTLMSGQGEGNDQLTIKVNPTSGALIYNENVMEVYIDGVLQYSGLSVLPTDSGQWVISVLALSNLTLTSMFADTNGNNIIPCAMLSLEYHDAYDMANPEIFPMNVINEFQDGTTLTGALQIVNYNERRWVNGYIRTEADGIDSISVPDVPVPTGGRNLTVINQTSQLDRKYFRFERPYRFTGDFEVEVEFACQSDAFTLLSAEQNEGILQMRLYFEALKGHCVWRGENNSHGDKTWGLAYKSGPASHPPFTQHIVKLKYIAATQMVQLDIDDSHSTNWRHMDVTKNHALPLMALFDRMAWHPKATEDTNYSKRGFRGVISRFKATYDAQGTTYVDEIHLNLGKGEGNVKPSENFAKGPNRVDNPDFKSPSDPTYHARPNHNDWDFPNVSNGWSPGHETGVKGLVHVANGFKNRVYQIGVAEVGKLYLVKFTLKVTQGGLDTMTSLGGVKLSKVILSSSKTYAFYIEAESVYSLSFYCTPNFTGRIYDISVNEYTGNRITYVGLPDSARDKFELLPNGRYRRTSNDELMQWE